MASQIWHSKLRAICRNGHLNLGFPVQWQFVEENNPKENFRVFSEMRNLKSSTSIYLIFFSRRNSHLPLPTSWFCIRQGTFLVEDSADSILPANAEGILGDLCPASCAALAQTTYQTELQREIVEHIIISLPGDFDVDAFREDALSITIILSVRVNNIVCSRTWTPQPKFKHMHQGFLIQCPKIENKTM